MVRLETYDCHFEAIKGGNVFCVESQTANTLSVGEDVCALVDVPFLLPKLRKDV